MFVLIQSHPEVSLFFCIVAGFLVGNIHIRGIGLGSVAGTLVVALVVGVLLKPQIPDLLRWAFFDLFLFAVGYSVGPQFFSSLKKETIPQLLLALVVAVSGLGAAVLAAWWLKLDPGLSAGLLSGSLSQSAALGTSLGAIHEMTGVTQATRTLFSANAPLADAVTYVMGEVGLILFATVIAPLLLKINLIEDGKQLDHDLGCDDKNGNALRDVFTPAVGIRAYVLSNAQLIGQSVGAMCERFAQGRVVVRNVVREGVNQALSDALILQENDVVTLMAQRSFLLEAPQLIGVETDHAGALNVSMLSRTLIIKQKKYAGKMLSELAQEHGSGLFLRGISRGQTPLPITPKMRIERGDALEVFGTPEDIERISKQLGETEREMASLDLVILAGGIVVGTLLGALQWYVHGVPLGLGSTGSILVVGLLAGWAHSRFAGVPGIPEPAIRILQDIGLKVFIAAVGLIAGPHALQAIAERGASLFVELFVAGIFVTMVGPMVGLFFGRYVLKMRSSLLIAGICGAQTCIGALNALKDATRSNAVTLGFTVTFAIGNVLLTVWGAIMVGISQMWM